MKLHNPNFGKSRFDPEFDEEFEELENILCYEQACEEREQRKKENNESK